MQEVTTCNTALEGVSTYAFLEIILESEKPIWVIY